MLDINFQDISPLWTLVRVEKIVCQIYKEYYNFFKAVKFLRELHSVGFIVETY